jgi:trk system potassium uptake protein TrkA
VDACVSPRLAMATATLKYVRPTGIASLAVVEHSNAEVFELVMPAESPILQRPLKELSVPRGAVIAVIVRNDQVIIPSGEDHLEADDHAIIFTLPDAIAQVEQFFASR